MSDEAKSLNILIKTATELRGAEAAARALEEQIGKAKATGQAYDELEKKLAGATAAIKEYKGAQAAQAKVTAEATAQQAAEAEAYAQAQASVINVTQEDIDKSQENAKATKAVTFEKHELHQAVKGLMMEFPELGHVAHLALNPIGFVVAGIAGAFAFWKNRIDELTETLSQVKLPDLGPGKVSQVSAVAEAYHKIRDAVRDATEEWKSVDSRHERHIKNLQEELEWQRQLLAVQKARDIATLEGNRGGMSDTEFQRRKNAIERNYAQAGIKAEQKTDADIIADREKRRDELFASSKQKEAQATAIKLPSEEDAGRVADLDAQFAKGKEAAQQQLEKAREMLLELAAYKAKDGNIFQQIARANRIRRQYGFTIDSPERMAEAQEEQKTLMASAQEQIDQANKHEKAQYERKRLAERRKQLLEQAAKEAAESAEIDLSLPEEKRHAARKAEVQGAVAGTEEQTRKAQRQAAESATELGQSIQRAAQIAHDIQSGKVKRYELSAEDQEFMKRMDKGVTGGRTGTIDDALALFRNAFGNPQRQDELFGRMSSVSALREASQAGRDFLGGKQLDDAHKELLLNIDKLLEGHANDLRTAARTMSKLADTVATRAELEAALARLNARMDGMDTKFGSQIIR